MTRRHFVLVLASDIQTGDRVLWPQASGAWSGELLAVLDVELHRNGSVSIRFERTLPTNKYTLQTGKNHYGAGETLTVEVTP